MKMLNKITLVFGVFCLFYPAPVTSIGLDPDLVNSYLKSIEVAEKRAATGGSGVDNFANFYLSQMGVAKRDGLAIISKEALDKMNSRVFKNKFERFLYLKRQQERYSSFKKVMKQVEDGRHKMGESEDAAKRSIVQNVLDHFKSPVETNYPCF